MATIAVPGGASVCAGNIWGTFQAGSTYEERTAQLEVEDCGDSGVRKVALRRLKDIINLRRAMESIDILQRVFGLDVNSRIRDPVSLHILTGVDGRLGDGTPYERFEGAMLAGAREIVS